MTSPLAFHQLMTTDNRDNAGSTRVSLNVGGCQNTQAELDHLADHVQKEALNATRPSMRLERMVTLFKAEKNAFTHHLKDILAQANIDLTQPLGFTLQGKELTLNTAGQAHPQARELAYLLAQAPKLADEFLHLEQHARAIEMGRIATAAYGDWKRHQNPSIARNMTRTAMTQLQSISGATLQHGQLFLVLEGQSQKHLSFQRKFHFA